ncbi:hypothetical protein PGTUg99_034281 [Puccinia graminis f. sp. tritici]|uniref:Uncharacterized protein n=1 Tax=Puccinia graminis f. sp. tritici TaxID=56615 RepID=A0A5B0RM13_PUCGR|nr:hypothetical protein PGTUg99_034281 [Puccinia graminis f. sp. tritici]
MPPSSEGLFMIECLVRLRGHPTPRVEAPRPQVNLKTSGRLGPTPLETKVHRYVDCLSISSRASRSGRSPLGNHHSQSRGFRKDNKIKFADPEKLYKAPLQALRYVPHSPAASPN